MSLLRLAPLGLALLLLPPAVVCRAADHDFDLIVKGIQTRYGTKPTHIPLLGLANFVTRTTHPEGVSGFRLAVFENLPPIPGGLDEIRPTTLQPLVRVHSSDEATYVYIGECGKSARLLVATFNSAEATIVEVRVSPEILRKSLEHPDQITGILGLNGGPDGSHDDN